MELLKIFFTISSMLWESLVTPRHWDATDGSSLHEVRTGADLAQEISMILQEAAVTFLDLGDEPETKLLSISDIFTPMLSTGFFAVIPLVIIFTMYLGVMFWASTSIRRADDHLQQIISDLNMKADQISEGIAALAQIYIDNPPPTYGRKHQRQQ